MILQFSRSVMSDSLQPHGLQHARLPCPSTTPELAQTHVHQVSDAIQPSHPLLSLSPPAFSLSQHHIFYSAVLSESTICERWRESRSLGQLWLIIFFDKNSQSLKHCLIVVFHIGKGTLGFLDGLDRKESACNAGDLDSIEGLGRSPGGGHDNPLQYYCPKNPCGQRSLVTVHEDSKSWAQLSN